MPLVTGVRLGPYEILGPLGAGGMGEVYRARDTRLDRTVAIKVLPEHLADDPDSRQRFEREARAVSSLNHPHICVLYDIGHQDGIDFLVMECLEGETLAARLTKGPLPVEQALQYGIQIAGALAAAHRRGISHRDLKPGNIVLAKTGAKLLDFGLAKWRAPGADPAGAGASMLRTVSQGLTEKGTILGTFQYMAPEQLEGKETDARADLFAFGSVLYEMLTGRRAFEGQSPASLISAIMTSDPPPISSLQALTPPALDRIVKKCLVKDPDGRWQSAQDLADELQWIAAGSSVTVAGQPGEPLLPAAGRSGRRRERLAWASACLFLLAVTILMAVVHYRSGPPPVQTTRSSLPPPPNFSFVPYNFAVSPDGARLAFVAVGADGKNALWVRVLSAVGAQPITGAEGAALPFWSPDSHRIGFFAEGKLKTVDVAGGAPRILCDIPLGLGGTWNRDGTILVASGTGGALLRISAAGGAPAPVSKPPQASGQGFRWPAFLPDGKHFLYFVDWSSPTDTLSDGIYLGSLDAVEAKRISSELRGNAAFSSGHLLYVRDRSLLAQPFDLGRLETTGPAAPIVEQELEKDAAFLQSGFSASENGVLVFQSATETPSRLVWFDSSGKELGQLPEAGYKDPGLSPDGRFLAATSDDDRNGKHFIRIHDLQRGISTRLTAGGSDEFPQWSRDGKRIAYLSGAATGNTISINEIPVDGSGPMQVLLKGAMMIPNGWSADGHLAFMDLAKSQLAVYSATDRQSRPLIAGGGAEAQFSPDGKWVAYWAPPTGDIFVQPFPGPGGRLQISRAGGTQVRWSRDGKRIFYIQSDKKLMEVSFDPQKGSAGAPRVLFQTRIVAPSFVLFQYDVAPDGRFLINSFPSNNSSPLTLLTGWTAQLKR